MLTFGSKWRPIAITQVHVGEQVEATITVEKLRATPTGGAIVFCTTSCATAATGRPVVTGEARVLVPANSGSPV